MKKINKKIKSPQYFPLFCGYIYVGVNFEQKHQTAKPEPHTKEFTDTSICGRRFF